MDAQITPTPYRLAKHHGDIDAPEISQTTRRYAYRLVGVVESMWRRDWIRKEQYDAFCKFERDLERANRPPGCTAAYDVSEVADLPDNDWGPLDRKIDAQRRVENALVAIGHPETAEAVRACATSNLNLEQIGRKFSAEKNKTAALAAGKQLVQIGLYRLAVHYGFVQSRDSPVAA